MHLCSFLKPHAGLVLVSLVCAGANGATIAGTTIKGLSFHLNGALTLDLGANSATGYGVQYRASSFSSFNAVAADNSSFAAAIVRLETEIPEPATLSLIGLTGLLLARRRK